MTILGGPIPQAVSTLAVAADDCLLPTDCLRWWREKDVYVEAFAIVLAIVRASNRDALIRELRSISSYLTWKIRHGQVADDDELDEYLAETVLALWVGRTRHRAADEIAGKLRDRAFTVVPTLRSKRTKDGLFRLDQELVLDSHYAVLGSVAIPPSMFLRRYFGGTPGFVFLRNLGVLASKHPECAVSVALDTAHWSPVADVITVFEEDYWYGPPFSLSNVDDPSELGTTRHWTRPPGEPLQYPVASTEFKWQLDSDTCKALEVEETYFPFEPEWDPQEGQPWFINRYVHSQRDMSSRTFVHLDGAVKLFAKDGYDRFVGRPKRSALHYRKLFRVDGPISDDEWIQLIAHYLRGNNHVHEYFGDAEVTSAPP